MAPWDPAGRGLVGGEKGVLPGVACRAPPRAAHQNSTSVPALHPDHAVPLASGVWHKVGGIHRFLAPKNN